MPVLISLRKVGVLKRPNEKREEEEQTNGPPKSEEKKIPVASRTILSPTASPRGGTALVDCSKVELNWDNIPKKLQSKILKSGLMGFVDINNSNDMQLLWRTLRLLYPEHFVPEKHNNPSMDSLISLGEKAIHKLDVPARKLYKHKYSAGGPACPTSIAQDLLKNKKLIAIKKLKHIRKVDQNYNLIEVGALSTSDHPNIVKFYDAFIESDPKRSDELWILMEHLPGGTVQESFHHCNLLDKHIAFYAREILKALQYLHQRNWVHRNIKPSNVMIDSTGQIKLIDFSLIADVGLGLRTGCVGSPWYMPPEMILLTPYGTPVDLWSLGVLLLELMSGTPPFYPDPLQCMFTVAKQGLIPFIPPTASPSATEFLKKCLITAPSDRSTATELLKEDWVNQQGIENGIADVLEPIFIGKQLSNML